MKENFVGVDCHKNTIACYQNGKFKEFSTTQKGYQKALEWAGNNAQWAVEGAFSVHLLKKGCKVYEINSLLTYNFRKTLSICGKKDDYGDAKVISLFAKDAPKSEVSLKTIELKEKLTSRELFVKQKTELINHIRSLFLKRGEKLSFNNLNTIKARKWLQNHEDKLVSGLGKTLSDQINLIEILEKEIELLLPEKAIKLTQIAGIATIRAAIIYTETKGKTSTKAQLANYAGVAPVKDASGQKNKYRSNKRGNRKLNSVFYQISLSQVKYDEKGREYFEKKVKEGKTKRHARKCLSRQIINLVWKILNDK